MALLRPSRPESAYSDAAKGGGSGVRRDKFLKRSALRYVNRLAKWERSF